MNSSKLFHRCLLVFVFCLPIQLSAQSLTKHVNPFVGTGGHGHTFPGATMPFGMVQLSPDTRTEGWDACGGYHYSDSTIIGFSHTHFSGTGVPDLGDILVVPNSNARGVLSGRWRNDHSMRFTHTRERAEPGYYFVDLIDDEITAELTASLRVGLHRYTFAKGDSASLLLDLMHGLGPDKVIDASLRIVGDREIVGYRRSKGWAKDQRVYFCAQFSEPFVGAEIFSGEKRIAASTAKGNALAARARFALVSRREILVKVALSSVSEANARLNLEREIPHWDFDRVRRDATAAWENELGKIEATSRDESILRIFYTALYHSMIAPNVQSDVDGRYRGMDGKIHTAKGFTMYTVFSLWDTFRAEHPLLSIIDQTRTRDFVRSLLAKYEESGVLPVWEFASNETWCMIGYHAIPVIVDSYMKGIRDFDAMHALDAMQRSADANRFGLSTYREKGYVAAERESESVSKTLEYAFDDWCIARFAQQLKVKDVAERFFTRSQTYRNHFDASTSFMRARSDGAWISPFDPYAVTNNYTEANAFQYSFFAPHDIGGLIALFGGEKKFIARLDTLFTTRSGTTGRQQADITGMIGQYAHGNEPSHHMPYLYNFTSQPWKTQSMVRGILLSQYSDAPDGLCGNDDCGQMSAWYVMSALGLYQVAPGNPTYTLSTPLLDRVVIRLENGKRFEISKRSENPAWQFIRSVALNERAHGSLFLSHYDLMQGGSLHIDCAATSKEAVAPRIEPAAIATNFVVTPWFETSARIFRDSTRVTIHHPSSDCAIHYTIDGTIPTVRSPRYTAPLVLTASTTLRAIAITRSGVTSGIESGRFIKSGTTGTVTLASKYDAQYTGGNDQALIDGITGSEDFRLGSWQGFHEVDLDATVDLGSEKEITSVGLHCLQDNNSWIFYPASVSYSFSRDGKVFSQEKKVLPPANPEKDGAMIAEFTAKVSTISARFIRVHAKNIGRCPAWHKGAGEQAWLFADEILIRTKK